MPKKIETIESVADSRFKMTNSDFEINKFSEEYMLRHPHLKKQLMKQKVEHQKQLEKQLHLKKKNKKKAIHK